MLYVLKLIGDQNDIVVSEQDFMRLRDGKERFISVTTHRWISEAPGRYEASGGLMVNPLAIATAEIKR
ncbi:MAG TPA: hypothetical protein VGU66_13645 [Candidatus Elarobacter sp.]|nr:hypothetical protein [Candidatus Elarobacter sp.]